MPLHAIVSLKSHRHVRRKDKEGRDVSYISMTLETEYVAEVAHGLVDLTPRNALHLALTPVQPELGEEEQD